MLTSVKRAGRDGNLMPELKNTEPSILTPAPPVNFFCSQITNTINTDLLIKLREDYSAFSWHREIRLLGWCRLGPAAGRPRCLQRSPVRRWAQHECRAKDEKCSRNSLIPALNELSGESKQSSQLPESALFNLVLLLWSDWILSYGD